MVSKPVRITTAKLSAAVALESKEGMEILPVNG